MPDLAEEISQETDRILLKLIDKAAREAEEEIEKTGSLSMEHAIPLLLKSQYNHILTLDKELKKIRVIMDERFTKMDERFTSMAKESASMFVTLNNKITDLYKWMFGCFIGTITILGSLMTFLKLFAK